MKYPAWLVPLLVSICAGLLALLTTLYLSDRARILSSLTSQGERLSRIEGLLEGRFGTKPDPQRPISSEGEDGSAPKSSTVSQLPALSAGSSSGPED